MELLDNLFEYSATGEITESENDVVNAYFDMIKQKIDIGNDKYAKAVEQRRQAGLKSAEKRRQIKQESENNESNNDYYNSTSLNSLPNDELNINENINENININENTNQNINQNIYENKNTAINKQITYTPNFNRFWAAYPKQADKVAVFDYFNKLDVDDDLIEKMLAAIKAQKNSADWQKEGGRYIPNPLNWLTRRRWEDNDEVPPEYRVLTAQEKLEMGLNPFE